MLAACGGNPTPSNSVAPSVAPSPTLDPIPAGVKSISAVQAITTKGEEVTTYGIYMGHSNKDTSYSGVTQINSLFLADGANYLQVYQSAKSIFTDLDKWVVGESIVVVTGTIAHYTKGSGTTYEIKGSDAYLASDPTSLIVKPVTGEVSATKGDLVLAQTNVSMPVAIKGVTVTAASANSYGNLTIKFKPAEIEYTLYLDSRYTDVSGIAVAVGDKITCDTWIGWDGKHSTWQFIYAINFAKAA